MCDQKRKRIPNWLPSEKNLLLELAEEHFSVIENKKTDGDTMKKKHAHWQIIAGEYNSRTTHCWRSAENLKNTWKSMKKNARREEALYRIHRVQTGEHKNDMLQSKIISLLRTCAVGPTHRPSLSLSKKIEALNEQNGAVDPTNTASLTSLKKIEQINDQNGAVGPIYTSSLSLLKKFEENDDQNGVSEKDPLHINEDHELDLQIKREQLKQEKIKTRMLLLDLRLKKNQLFKHVQ